MRRSPFLFVLLAAGACSAGIALADLADAPRRKSGLWELKAQVAGMPDSPALQQCVDQASDDLMGEKAREAAQSMCSKTELRREGTRYVIESVCTLGNSTATTSGYFEGDFDVAYHGETHVHYQPAAQGMKDAMITLDARWLGPCKAGQRPGDIVMPDGGTLNLNEALKHPPKAKAP